MIVLTAKTIGICRCRLGPAKRTLRTDRNTGWNDHQDGQWYIQVGSFRKLELHVMNSPYFRITHDQETGTWLLASKIQLNLGHHNPKIYFNEGDYEIVHKFDLEEKQLDDFVERCNQYQDDKDSTILSHTPVAVIKVQQRSQCYVIP